MITTGLVFTVLIALVLPIVLSVLICTRKKGYWKPLLAGALCFFFFQIVIRIPILQLVLPKMQWYIDFATNSPVLYILFLSATAAIFEEVGRYVVMRLFLKKRQTVGDALSFGVGHGSIEAILIVGINYLIYLIAQSPAILQQFTAPLAFAAGIERLFTMMVHIGLSVIVMKSVREKKIMLLLLALLIHTLVNFVSVYALNVMQLNLWIVEGIIALSGAALLWYSIHQYKKSKSSAEIDPESQAPEIQ